MEIKRDLENKKIYLIEKEKQVLEHCWCGADFVICLSTDHPIIITKQTDEYLYMNLKQILENQYEFYSHGLSYQNDNKIVWFSDGYCDMDDEYSINSVNRLILEKLDEQIIISVENPFFNSLGIKREDNFIAFSPAGNGFLSKNLDTGLTFQDDIVTAFRKILMCISEKPKRKIKRKIKRI